MGYLDSTGLAHLWEKIKSAIDEKLEGVTAQEVYSTKETRIGTWIDGRPLYSITFTNVTLPSGTAAVNILNISNLNIDSAIDVHGSVYSTGHLCIPVNSYNTVWYSSLFVTFDSAASTAYLRAAAGGDLRGKSAVVTLKYTKTTDEATIRTETQVAAADVISFGYDMEADIPVMPTTAQFYEEV